MLGFALLLDFGSRFLPYELVSFRGWEPLIRHGILWRGGLFEPNREYVSQMSYGELSARGNEPNVRHYRPETFTTDAFGFRNPAAASEVPVDVILVGTSFTVGSSLSDHETLGAQLSAQIGEPVYNAGGAELGDEHQLTELIRRLGLSNGLVIHEYVESAASPHPNLLKPTLSAKLHALIAPHLASRQESATRLYSRIRGWLRRSPLKIALHLQYKQLNDNRLLPNSFAHLVARGELTNGDPILFHPEQRKVPPPTIAASAVAYWRTMSARLKEKGLKQLVVLVPSQHTVYGRLVTEPHESIVQGGKVLREMEDGLRKAGVPVVNLTTIFVDAARTGLSERRYLYFRDDTHWTGFGVGLAAAEIAKGIRDIRARGASGTALR